MRKSVQYFSQNGPNSKSNSGTFLKYSNVEFSLNHLILLIHKAKQRTYEVSILENFNILVEIAVTLNMKFYEGS